MTLKEAIESKLDTIILQAGTYEDVKGCFEALDTDKMYYFTGTFYCAIGKGLIPPCDIEYYKAQGYEIGKADKWVRRGCFAG